MSQLCAISTFLFCFFFVVATIIFPPIGIKICTQMSAETFFLYYGRFLTTFFCV